MDRAVFVQPWFYHWGSDFPHVLAGCGYIRSRYLLSRAATFLPKEELDLMMGGTAERLWFG